ncbi:ferredoxin [Kitasatospora viridis]|uniref:Ferredoxin n=1 Tax=Kitasatospora viridis TaxID=281105 RepID=A0A561UAN7_9ACTN|nr:ferredoxin [Kitasatospora viridis]TWF96423.1 ferredoxin [Kitasatospora viridis]
MHVSVDQDRCCSSGQCVLAVPTVFDQDEEEGVVRLLDADPSPELDEKLRTAAALCPAGAISLTEVAR